MGKGWVGLISKATQMGQEKQTFYSHNPLYEPVFFPTDKSQFSLRISHGTKGKVGLHAPRDRLNQGRGLESIVVSYRINGSFNPLYTVADFIRDPQLFEPESSGSLQGDVGERIARRVSKYALQHHANGETIGIFGENFDPEKEYVVANTDLYVLKIRRYPNMVILKKLHGSDKSDEGDERFGYISVKEIDGLMAYRCGSQRHIIMLESKTGKTKQDVDHLSQNLIAPMRELFPDTALSYLLFAPEERVLNKSTLSTHRGLSREAEEVYQSLHAQGVSTIFYTFTETDELFRNIVGHLQMSFALFKNRATTITGKTKLSDGKIQIFGHGTKPVLSLALGDDGTYHVM